MMKTRILVILFVFALGAASCSRNEEFLPEARQRISYDVLTSKSAIAFPTSLTFKSTAYYLSTENWDDRTSTADIYMDGNNALEDQEVKFMGTYWGTDTEFAWPSSGKLTFFSYRQAKVSATVSDEGVAFPSWNVSTYRDEPFDDQVILVADIAKDKTQNESYASYSGVPTHFKHKLSKLSFSAAISSLAPEGTSVKITSMYISGIYLQGDYANGGYSYDGWSSLSSPSANYPIITSDEELTDTLALMGVDMVMIPQILSSSSTLCLEYTVTDADGNSEDKTSEISFIDQLRNGSWEPGTFYNYKLHIGVGVYPIEFDGSVSDWTGVSAGDIIIGE